MQPRETLKWRATSSQSDTDLYLLSPEEGDSLPALQSSSELPPYLLTLSTSLVMDASEPVMATYFSDPEPPATSATTRYSDWEEEPCLLLRRETPLRALTDRMHALQLSAAQSKRGAGFQVGTGAHDVPGAASLSVPMAGSHPDGGRRARRRSHELCSLRAPQISVSASAPASRSSSLSSRRLSRRSSRRRSSRVAPPAAARGFSCLGDAAAMQYYGLVLLPLPAVQLPHREAGERSEASARMRLPSLCARASTDLTIVRGADRGSVSRRPAAGLPGWPPEAERRTPAIGTAGNGNYLMQASEVCRQYLEFVSQR